MRVRTFMFIVVVTSFVAIHCAFAQEAAQTKWLKEAELGTFTSKTQNWKAIEAAARKEGKVVIYSLSSRIFKLQEEFKKEFGIEIEAFDLPSDVQLERFRREHKAGRFTVDVIYNREVPMILNEFLPQKLLWNFVPDPVAPFLDKNEKEPLLVQRWSSRVLFYNSAVNPKGCPIDNLWDLTREEWKSRVLFVDPLADSTDANMFQTILKHSGEMATAYQKEFGNPVVFSQDLLKVTKKLGLEADASKEWLFRLLRNKPVFIGSSSTVFKNIADVSQKNPPVGFTTFSNIKEGKPKVHEAQPAYDLIPIVGVSAPVILAISDRAPHPNAAKLLIRYMMEKGFGPWNDPGDYAARSDVLAHQVKEHKIPSYEDLKKWVIDPDYVYDTKFDFLQLFINLK